MADVTLKMFMDGLFPPEMLEEDEHPIIATAVQTDTNVVFPVAHWNPRSKGGTHTCVSTFGNMRNDAGKVTRKRANVIAVWVLQLDDVGTKSKRPPIEPSVILETKPGNFTYLYMLDEPCTDLLKFETITNSLAEAGYGDENCTDPLRLFRLPGSLPAGKEHAAKLILWRPDRLYSLDTILRDMKVREVALRPRSTGNAVPAPAGVAVTDAVLEWLQEQGYALKAEADGWWQVVCPWTSTCHSDHRNVAKYKPADEADTRRIFWCWHTHGQEAVDDVEGTPHQIDAFLAWVKAQGGPDCRPVEQPRSLAMLGSLIGATPETARAQAEATGVNRGQTTPEGEPSALDLMIEHLVWHSTAGRIYDLREAEQGYPLHTTEGVKWAWYPDFPTDSKGKVIDLMRVWKAGRKKVTSVAPYMDPRRAPGWDGAGINLYLPFIPGDEIREEDQEAFLRLARHVFPDDCDYALDWMAYKLLHPEERMVALVSYTPQFGTGRNAVFHIMRLLLGEKNCAHMTASRLFGEKQNQFNSHLANLMITLGEVDEGDASADRRVSDKVFNRLKEMVDPNERSIVLESKGVDGRLQEIFTSFMIATNAGAGIPLEQGDRRFSVLSGNDVPLDVAHPDLKAPGGFLDRARQDRDHVTLSSIHAALAARDLSKFSPSTVLDTHAKRDMMEERKNDIDIAIEEVLHGYTVFTVNRVIEALRANPEIALNYDRKDVARQVKGWARKHSAPPKWVGSQSGQVFMREYSASPLRPRVLNGYGNGIETEHREALARFLTEVKSVVGGNVTPFKG